MIHCSRRGHRALVAEDGFQELTAAAKQHGLAKADYAGYVGHEFRPKEDLLAGLQSAFEVCRGD